MNGAYCPPGQPAAGAKQKKPRGSGERYMKQYAQAQALRRRSARKQNPPPPVGV